jgi:hypothetical protein
MKTQVKVAATALALLTFSLGNRVVAQEKKAEKAKAEKVAGDIGLLDTEKNYMIVVTKDGKLVTVDYTTKTKVTELKPSQAKMSDIGLGSKATVEYVKKGDKNYLTKIEFIPAKGE